MTAQRIIRNDMRILRAAITRAEETALHIATGAKHIQFVKELVNLMDETDLALQDCKGNTAFCYAALTGSMEIAKIMMCKNNYLPLMRGGQGMTALYVATLFGHSEMAWFLYPITKDILDQEEWVGIFFTCFHSDLYGKCTCILHHLDMYDYLYAFYFPYYLHELMYKYSACVCIYKSLIV